MRGNRAEKKSTANRILDIVIGLLCVVLVGSAVFAVTSFRDASDIGYSESLFVYRLEEEDFDRMTEMYHSNEAAGIKADQKLEPYYGIAEYFEAASYYKAAVHTNDAEGMMHYRQKMDAAEQRMGELSFVSEIIREKLALGE